MSIHVVFNTAFEIISVCAECQIALEADVVRDRHNCDNWISPLCFSTTTFAMLVFMDSCRFSALLALCAGDSPVTGEFLAQRPVTRSSDVFFDMRLNIRLSKQSWGWWFETPLCSLWRHCNESNGPHIFNPCQTKHISENIKHIFIFFLIFQDWVGTGSCHFFPRKGKVQ